MHKLKLDLDDLRVDSFDTGAEADRLGTVRANQELEAGDAEIITAPTPPKPISYDTNCRSICFTCFEPTCDSCHATTCRTLGTPECCA